MCYSLAKFEDVQYFQFDSDGNMYVYEGGAGCTGHVRKVEPGDELIWKDYNTSDAMQMYELTND